MKFRKLFVKLSSTDHHDYGYQIDFGRNLNIIRGDNSSGKSTFVNSLIYALGMEEIIGSKGNASLPYALKTKFDVEGTDCRVIESTVYLEVENQLGQVITLKRAIVSKDVDTKLIQIIEGPYLTSSSDSKYTTKYTFVHDPGSAQDPKKGFFAFLERFLGLELPQLSDNKGRETKLYLQSVFSALLIEQKRGWTDYIANIPYYGISSMREKVSSFLLDLDVFRNAKKLNELQSERSSLISNWSELATEVKLSVENKNLTVSGVTKLPSVSFDPQLVSIGERRGAEFIDLTTIKTELSEEWRALDKNQKDSLPDESQQLVSKITETENRIDELLVLQSMSGSQIKINESQLKQYQESLESIEKDLKSNKLTKKLVNFGADEAGLSVAQGQCHTCMQTIDDILLSPDSVAMPMSLDENIKHLENQRKMTKSLIEGLEKNIERDKGQLLTINREVITFRRELVSLKRDIKSTNSVKEADVRRKIHLENRESDIRYIEEAIEGLLSTLKALSVRYKCLNGDIEKLSKHAITQADWQKVQRFSEDFRSLASGFGYRSAEVSEIEIKTDTLLPYLKDIELREVEKTSEETVNLNLSADVKSDSSASDFVRLIWAYLIALYTASNAKKGNHPGVILFDEPAQHSMSTKSVNVLLKTLMQASGLQSIVAASFDESDENYAESVTDIDLNSFKFKRLPRKIIQRLS